MPIHFFILNPFKTKCLVWKSVSSIWIPGFTSSIVQVMHFPLEVTWESPQRFFFNCATHLEFLEDPLSYPFFLFFTNKVIVNTLPQPIICGAAAGQEKYRRNHVLALVCVLLDVLIQLPVIIRYLCEGALITQELFFLLSSNYLPSSLCITFA